MQMYFVEGEVYQDHLFWGSSQSQIRVLAGIFAANLHDREAPEWRWLSNLADALDEARGSLSVLSDFSRINASSLLTARRSQSDGGDEAIGLRKPRIVVDVTVTTAGNLTVRWFKDAETPDDLLFCRDEFRKEPFARPMNELLFVRGFDETLKTSQSWRDMPDMEWRAKAAQRIADAALYAVGEVLKELESRFDVKLDWRVVPVRFGRSGWISDWRLENSDHIRARQEARKRAAQERKRREEEEARAEWLARRHLTLECAASVYGVSPARLVGIVDAGRNGGLTTEQALSVLGPFFGVRPTKPDIDDRKNVVAVRRAMKDVGMETEAVALKERELECLVSSKAEFVAKAKRDRRPDPKNKAKMAAASRARTEPPDYSGLKPYRASGESLAKAGFASVMDVVIAVNAKAIAAGQYPVTQGDFPVDRITFERLLKRLSRLDGGNAAAVARP